MKPTVNKKANQFVSFKLGDLQRLDIMKFPGGTTSLDSFFKSFKTSETKSFFRDEEFDCRQKMIKSEISPSDAFLAANFET